MDITRLVTEFQSLPAAAQIESLVRFAHELTIVGRDCYEPTSAGLRHPDRLRSLNEIQHRVVSHVLALLAGDPHRYPDDVLLSLILEKADVELSRQIAAAFGRSVSQPATIPGELGPGAVGAGVDEPDQATGYPGILNGQVGVTTVGAVRAAGGDVTPSPSRTNQNHASLHGLTPEQASELFRPTVPNPQRKRK